MFHLLYLNKIKTGGNALNYFAKWSWEGNKVGRRGAARAQWIRLRLPGSSPKHTFYTFIILYWFVWRGKNENKQKEARIGPLKKKVGRATEYK